MKTHDPVNHPSHYCSHPSGVECITITRHMGFCLGNAVKYLWRAGMKDSAPPIQDLEKAIWYIQEEIKLRRLGTSAGEPTPAKPDGSKERPLEEGTVWPGDWIKYFDESAGRVCVTQYVGKNKTATHEDPHHTTHWKDLQSGLPQFLFEVDAQRWARGYIDPKDITFTNQNPPPVSDRTPLDALPPTSGYVDTPTGITLPKDVVFTSPRAKAPTTPPTPLDKSVGNAIKDRMGAS